MWFAWLILLVPVFCQETTPSIVVTPFLSPRHGTSGIVIQCTVKSSPVATLVGWRKVSLFASTSEDIDASNKNGKYHIIDSKINPHLTINNIIFSDEANYVCFATNGAGTGQSNYARLTNVTSEIPSILATPQKQFPVNGTPQIIIKCNISSSPTATSVGWERTSLDGSSTEAIVAAVSNGKYHIDDSLVYPHLTINDVSFSDDAYFACFAANVAGKGISNSARVDVIDSPLEVHAPETEYSPSVGSTVTLQCSVISGTATSIKWLKNNDIIAMAESTRLTGGTKSHPSLIISSVEEDDLGYYICQATNGFLTVNTNDIVLVPKDINAPLSIKAEITHYSPILSTSVTLNCEIITGKATSVKWFQNNDIIVTTNNPKFSGGTLTSPSLIISQVEQIDFGYYVCQATDGVDTVSADEISLSPKGIAPTVNVPQQLPSPAIGQQLNISCTIELIGSNLQKVQWIFKDLEGKINDPIIISTTQPFKYKGIPEIQIFYTEYHVYFGSAITLDCQVSANPAHTTVQWKKIVDEYQSIIVPNDTYSGSTLSTPALTIFNADLGDEGYYICTASNSLGTGQSVQKLFFPRYPSSTDSRLHTHQVNIGHLITLSCDIIATPTQTTVQWLRSINGSYQPISFHDNKYGGSTVTTPHLTILNTDLNDEGYYICTASNSIGTGKSLEAYLDVLLELSMVSIAKLFYLVLGEHDGISSSGEIIVQSSCTGDACYRLVKEKMNWEQANFMCLFRFGDAHHLVTISSQEEQEHLNDEISTEQPLDGISTEIPNYGISTGIPNERMSTEIPDVGISIEVDDDEISTEVLKVGITTELPYEGISTEEINDGISEDSPMIKCPHSNQMIGFQQCYPMMQ
ncbi:unnamed protein product [Mytilus edulis]|uniref:Ig-like domain-containing protein n=1 Tax=Mytilus edulis TaxID=6550 RepID=A0A8S3TBX9_MYTED|nr:unnamed protein product [Mytilus edulis]